MYCRVIKLPAWNRNPDVGTMPFFPLLDTSTSQILSFNRQPRSLHTRILTAGALLRTIRLAE